MSNAFVISGLMERASEIKGKIAALEGQLAKLKDDLEHVRATLRMFDPAYEERRIYPKRPPSKRLPGFVQGEIRRRCQDAVRKGDGPVSAEEIAVKAIAEKGMDIEDAKIRSDMIRRFLYALHRLAQDGTVRRIGHGLGARWAPPLMP